ncbi:MAG: DNA-processing protein DprA [Armatimonas sp.]
MTRELYALTLLATPRVGRQSAKAVLAALPELPSSHADIREAFCIAHSRNSRITIPSLNDIGEAEIAAQEKLLLASRHNINLSVYGSSSYPILLTRISDAPIVLFSKGNITCLTAPSVAVIGTREPSDYGIRLGEKFGAAFASLGFVVVSGLATGCDTLAHRGCLSASGVTVAVMAHGLDMVYPAENRRLAQEIIDEGGCLVSEYLPGEKPRRNYFVERDRLQSALSLGVVVIETDIKGGTMHTVGFCLDQGKPLACLSHPPEFSDHPKANGNKKLIKDGKATALATREDILFYSGLLNDAYSQKPPVSSTNPSGVETPTTEDIQSTLTFTSQESDSPLVSGLTQKDNTDEPRHIVSSTREEADSTNNSTMDGASINSKASDKNLSSQLSLLGLEE